MGVICHSDMHQDVCNLSHVEKTVERNLQKTVKTFARQISENS